MCLGTQVFAQQEPIYRELDVKSGLFLSQNSNFGINRTNTIGTIRVSVYDKDSYKKEDKGASAFLYGFDSGNTINTFENNPFGINRKKASWCHLGHCSGFFMYDEDNGYVYDSSNSLKEFKRAITTKAHYTETTDNAGQGFYSITTGKIDVRIEIEQFNGATLESIRSIKIPGMETMINYVSPRIEVYRGNNIIPVTTIKFADFATSNLVVYEGDSVVFKKDRSPHNRILGLTDIAIARWAGESIFMTEEDIKGTDKPFLFFDSNVHGVKMRTHPKSWKGKTKYPIWIDKTAINTPESSKYWIANRRRDYLIDNPDENNNNVALSAYKTKEEFNSTGGFPNRNKFSGDNVSLVRQRNNQKEGLNVELLDAYENGLSGVAGLDPDELIYKDFNRSKIVGDHGASSNEFTYVTKDRWKEIDQADGHINATLIKSFSRIRRFIGDNNALFYKGHEILDKNLFVHNLRGIEIIDGKQFHYSHKQPMFNNKIPIVFNPRKTNPPLLHHKSKLSWKVNSTTREIKIAVLSPLEGKRVSVDYDALTNDQRKDPKVNFYGIIEGPTFVARNQENVRYSVENLPTYSEAPGRFELVYTHEDSNGFLIETRKIVENNHNYVDITFGGGGYHEITLQYKRNKDKNATPVIIAGKELIDVDLRFIFSPDKKDGEDFSYNPEAMFGNHQAEEFTGVERLFENKGSGKRWFLDDMSPYMKEKDYGLKHGYKDHNVVRTYVLNKGQSLTLSVLDADPHNFTHYQPDWYLSERRLSKRVTDNELKNPFGQHKIQWFASRTVDFEISTQLDYGKHQTITPSDIYRFNNSTIYVKAVYNNTSEIKVKFKKKDVAIRPEDIIKDPLENIGVVKSYPLSDTQFTVFKAMVGNNTPEISGKDNFRIFAVQDLLSSYEYTKGPRYIVNGNSDEVGEHKRFSVRNNFDARFNMSFKTAATGSDINFSNISYDFTNAPDPSLNEWFPKNWIRHLDGTPQSPEIPSFDSASYIKAFDESEDPYIENYNNLNGDLYEPWQVRLPWIAQTGLHGYKTRWNIKTIFDINKIFQRSQIGTAYRVDNHTTTQYQNAVNGINGSNIIPKYNAQHREAQVFYWHLKTGRMVIIDKAKLNYNSVYVTVTNNKKGESLGHQIFKGTVNLAPLEAAYKTLNLKETAISKTDFSIYPNPINDGRFSLEFGLKEKGLASFEIFNIAGQLMFQKKNQNLDQGNHKIEFGKSDVNLASGVYLLKVVTKEFTETRKLFVE